MMPGMVMRWPGSFTSMRLRGVAGTSNGFMRRSMGHTEWQGQSAVHTTTMATGPPPATSWAHGCLPAAANDSYFALLIKAHPSRSCSSGDL